MHSRACIRSIIMAAHTRNLRRRQRERNVRRRPRIFKDRSNPLEDLEEADIFERYRFHPATIYFILGQLNLTAAATRRNMPLPPVLTLLVGLRYLATGAIQILVGDSLNLSRATAGKCIRTTVSAINQIARRCVAFPSGNDAVQAKQDFYRIAGFPNVLGCIDGTFVRIMKPHHNEADYINRKGYHALNVQMCCDAHFRFTSVNASWPGSVHDSRIFRSSALCDQFENGQHDGFLLGDSGYPCRKFLLTPFLNPTTPGEIRYNNACCRTRVLVEQSFGILKRRFQVLQVTIRTTPEFAVQVVMACVALHNIGIDKHDILQTDPVVQQNDRQPIYVQHTPPDGNLMRRHVMETYFS